jgi:hypothetical protein
MRNVNKGLESNSGLEKVRHWLTSPMYDDVTANVRAARRFAKRFKEAEMREGIHIKVWCAEETKSYHKYC